MVRRSAFTLIELIFAIVIIAISVVSLPMMNQAIAKGIDANLVQEAIFAAATELNEAVSANWDENSIDPASPNSYARVIDHSGNCVAATKRMPGHILQKLHRRCLSDLTIDPSDGTATAIVALDDMAHTNQNIFVNATTDATGYKKKYFSTVEVDRNVSFDGANNPDIKRITITIRDEDNNILTSLKTYSANIGEIDYFKKAY